MEALQFLLSRGKFVFICFYLLPWGINCVVNFSTAQDPPRMVFFIYLFLLRALTNCLHTLSFHRDDICMVSNFIQGCRDPVSASSACNSVTNIKNSVCSSLTMSTAFRFNSGSMPVFDSPWHFWTCGLWRLPLEELEMFSVNEWWCSCILWPTISIDKPVHLKHLPSPLISVKIWAFISLTLMNNGFKIK